MRWRKTKHTPFHYVDPLIHLPSTDDLFPLVQLGGLHRQTRLSPTLLSRSLCLRRRGRSTSSITTLRLLLIELRLDVVIHLIIVIAAKSAQVLWSDDVTYNGLGPSKLNMSSRVITSFSNNNCATFSTSAFFRVNSSVVLLCASRTMLCTALSSA